MRKKLLALVMCATMVLGTAVTAVAAPLKADYDNAKKIFTNGAKVISEMTTNGSKKQVPVTVNVDLEGGVPYGFTNVGTADAPDYRAVRLNEKGDKALKYIGTIDINKTVVTTNAKGDIDYPVVVNASQVTTKAVEEAKTKYGKDAKIDGKKVAYVTDISAIENENAYKVAVVTFGKDATTDAPGKPGVAYYTLKNASKIVSGKISEDADFMTKDKYSYDESNDALYKAILQTSSEVGSYVYAPAQTGYTDTELRTVAYALEAKTLTKDAIALVFDVNQIVKATDGDTTQHPYVLKTVTSPVADVTLTLENDWFSNTKLFAKNLKTFRVSNTWSSDGKYNLLALVQSGLDLSTPYGKFDVTFSVVEGQSVVIFDLDADAAKDNAGQADADKSTSSPKTGDVAPIAALAVVMMGAFGAMVVASKKRA